MKQAHCLIVLLGALTLAACGGGGGGGGGGAGGGGPGPTGASYTIGGTATGVANYSSSGMVLQDNGGDNLTVTSDGTFTFKTAVSGAYAVTVATQPTGETCTVTNGSGTASANVTTVAVSCSSALAGNTSSNVAQVSVGTFPADVTAAAQTFNIPIVTITVCGTTCGNVQVLVDTGSSGLRLMPNAAASLGLVAEADTRTPGNTYAECAYYADGYAWGGVYTATQVKIAGETASAVPVQVISTSAAPTSCVNSSPAGNTDLDTPDAFSADGVLGIGPAAQDCGSACTSTAIYYYSCPAGGCTAGATTSTVAAVGDEVTNPVTLFAKDKNGTLLQLPSISAAGAVSATGYLAFGIGTESDNGLGNATVIPLNTNPPQDLQPLYLTTSFNGTNNEDGIIDSGSNAYFFADSSLTPCTGNYVPFYCPATTTTLTATNSGGGTTSQVSFQITNLSTVNSSNFALNDVGGSAPTVGGTTYFDWGLPFFYGRTVYTIIEGGTVGTQAYATGGFAY